MVFHLQDNVRWHNKSPVNGRSLTAEDIVFSYIRQSRPESPNSPLMRNIKTIEPLSRLQIRITLNSPDADFLDTLADGHSKIVAKEAVEQSGDLKSGPTIGTGPWALNSSEAKSLHEFSRHNEYFESGLPRVDQILFHVLPDTATRSAAFKVSLLDVHQMEASEWKEYASENPNAPFLLYSEPTNG